MKNLRRIEKLEKASATPFLIIFYITTLLNEYSTAFSQLQTSATVPLNLHCGEDSQIFKDSADLKSSVPDKSGKDN